MEYGIQMYSVRDITKDDLRGALKRIADIGYRWATLSMALAEQENEDQGNADEGEGGADGEGNRPDVCQDVGRQSQGSAGRQGPGKDLAVC